MLSGISALLGALRALERDNGQAVLATVVKVEGSAYRRPGARMLIVLTTPSFENQSLSMRTRLGRSRV